MLLHNHHHHTNMLVHRVFVLLHVEFADPRIGPQLPPHIFMEEHCRHVTESCQPTAVHFPRFFISAISFRAIITSTSVCISCFLRCMSAGPTGSSGRGSIVKTRTKHVGISHHDNMLRYLPPKVSQQVTPILANTHCQDR